MCCECDVQNLFRTIWELNSPCSIFCRLMNEKEAHLRLQQEPKFDLSSKVQSNKINSLDDELKKMSLAQLDRVQPSSTNQQNVFMNHRNSLSHNNMSQQNSNLNHNSLLSQQSVTAPAYNSVRAPISNMFPGFPAQPMQSVSMKSPSQWPQNSSLCNFSDLSPLNKNKVPMNSMMGSTAMGFNPASSVTNFNSTSQSVKPLSSSDINDLLNWDQSSYHFLFQYFLFNNIPCLQFLYVLFSTHS